MSRLTVYQRLKPEIKEALHSSENAKYQASIDFIVDAFSSTEFYSELKISDISSLYTFTHLELHKVSAWDFKYGENILIPSDLG
jgi:4-hydroxy-L-threonine phosphate dehydrogenase PdxA